MSAHVVNDKNIDLLVQAAIVVARRQRARHGGRFSWWQTDDDGDYAGWSRLDESASDEGGEPLEVGEERLVSPTALGRMLLAENEASVAYRYDEPAGEVDHYSYRARASVGADLAEITPGLVFELIDNLDYQSCEHPGWRASEAHAFLTALRKAWCDVVVEESGTPELYNIGC